MSKSNVIKVAAAAAAVVACGPAQAAQPVLIDLIRCSDNGIGNGIEILVAAGAPPAECVRFQPGVDQQPPGNPNTDSGVSGPNAPDIDPNGPGINENTPN